MRSRMGDTGAGRQGQEEWAKIRMDKSKGRLYRVLVSFISLPADRYF